MGMMKYIETIGPREARSWLTLEMPDPAGFQPGHEDRFPGPPNLLQHRLHPADLRR